MYSFIQICHCYSFGLVLEVVYLFLFSFVLTIVNILVRSVVLDGLLSIRDRGDVVYCRSHALSRFGFLTIILGQSHNQLAYTARLPLSLSSMRLRHQLLCMFVEERRIKPFLKEIFVATCCFRVKEESARIWRVNEKGKERKRKRKIGKTAMGLEG